MQGKITIRNQSGPVATIDVEGIIGVPEQWQFDDPGQRVATFETFRRVVEQIKKVESPEVVVNIRSCGGNVNDALLIFDALAELDARVTTRCFGYVASAATIIAQAGDEGRREISANSLYLVHRSVCAAEGNREEMRRAAGVLDETDDRIVALYAERSGRPAEQFRRLMDENDGKGRWLRPDEVVELALADRVIAKARIGRGAGREVADRGLPPIPKTKQRTEMNITKRWNAILENMGLAAPREEAVCNEVAAVTEPAVEAPAMYAGAGADGETAELRERIAVLESQNARLAVKATATLRREDPSMQQDVHMTANEEAYSADTRRFRQ